MSENKNGEEEKSMSSDEDNECSTNSSSLKSSLNDKNISEETIRKKIDNSINNSGIIEVYEDNFIQELKRLNSLIKVYNYIGMDTEFPGIVFSLTSLTDDFYYKSLKLNVDSLKLIQLGITLSNEKGEFPKPNRTWQFNFEFDYTKDKSSKSSMNLLINSGIDFIKIKKCGINHAKFIEQFKNSGLVLNPNVHWISFHGSYDFAYLLSNLLNNSLPPKEEEFTQILGWFFPNHYDIRILVKSKDFLKGSLNKLANCLNVEREGKKHQAGSDSLVTIKIFWKLINSELITKKQLIEQKNIIYGILKGKDNKETINYTKINYTSNSSMKTNKNTNMNMNNSNKYMFNNWNNYNNNMNKKINNNMNCIPYSFGNNAYSNLCMNYCYPQIMANSLYNNIGFNAIQMINYRNNISQYC
jgi:CCR4-NOT transcription complex subunit 7/8